MRPSISSFTMGGLVGIDIPPWIIGSIGFFIGWCEYGNLGLVGIVKKVGTARSIQNEYRFKSCRKSSTSTLKDFEKRLGRIFLHQIAIEILFKDDVLL